MAGLYGRTRPACVGTDQSAKDYYFFLGEAQKQFVSEPIISLSNGNICIAVSTLMKREYEKNNIICADIDCNVPVESRRKK
jgi:hypothetical protein